MPRERCPLSRLSVTLAGALPPGTFHHGLPSCWKADRCCLIRTKRHYISGNRCVKMLKKKSLSRSCLVADPCSAKGCKAAVPTALAEEHLCILHYTLFIEQECAEIRRETALGNASHERQVEFIKKIGHRGESLVEIATGGYTMSDEMKARILSTLLTLMNCRENMDRAAMRQSALRRFVG